MYISFTAGDELCSKKKCTRQGQVCSVNENNQAECRCRDSCPRSDRKRVCGSDGITYPNRCHLDMTSCKLSYTITVVSNGTCGGESSLLAIGRFSHDIGKSKYQGLQMYHNVALSMVGTLATCILFW